MRMRSRAHTLALLHGGGRSQGRSIEDPDTPANLLAMIKHWHLGKPYALGGGNKILLPWMSMELIDTDAGEVIHPIDDLHETTNEEELAHEVWERCKQAARNYDDGLPHRFKLVCQFSNDDNSVETFETWSDSVTLPMKNAEFGSRTNHQARLAHGGRLAGGKYGASTMPHHSDQEIEWMSMAHTMTQQVFYTQKDMIESQSKTIATLTAGVDSVMKLQRELNNDKNKHRIERFESRVKMGALRVVAERFAKIGPPAALQLMKWMGDKTGGGGRAKTEREELAFKVMKVIALKIKSNTGAKTQEDFVQALTMFGIDKDDPIVEDIQRLLLEYTVDTETKAMERELGGSLVPVKKGKPGAMPDPDEDLPLDDDEDEDEDDDEEDGNDPPPAAEET